LKGVKTEVGEWTRFHGNSKGVLRKNVKNGKRDFSPGRQDTQKNKHEVQGKKKTVLSNGA